MCRERIEILTTRFVFRRPRVFRSFTPLYEKNTYVLFMNKTHDQSWGLYVCIFIWRWAFKCLRCENFGKLRPCLFATSSRVQFWFFEVFFLIFFAFRVCWWMKILLNLREWGMFVHMWGCVLKCRRCFVRKFSWKVAKMYIFFAWAVHQNVYLNVS